MLGGKCVDCKDENFYSLEIDHINNDGDGERKFYNNIDKKYLNNTIRAKQRLEVRCKKCHEKRHHPFTPEKISLCKLFINTIRDLEGDSHIPVPEIKLIRALHYTEEFDLDSARNYIRRMLREASIYESKIGHYNSVAVTEKDLDELEQKYETPMEEKIILSNYPNNNLENMGWYT